MILETKRLILRPWAESDAADLYAYAKDPKVGPVAGWPPHESVANSLDVIRHVLSGPETYALCLKQDRKAIGSISLMIGQNSNLKLPKNEAEIGYWLGVPFWGQGLMPEAAKALIRHAFDDLHLDTLWCGYFDGNIQSKRVQEKCGFRYHHTKENILWPLMNDIRTEHISRFTKREWQIAHIVKLSDRKDLKDQAAAWFSSKWRVPVEAYAESIADSFSAVVPQWYLYLEGEQIVAGMGVIENDFHDRKDLAPNVCAVYTEPEYRSQGIAGTLLHFVCEDMKANGIDTLYLLTDHTGFYERYGWEFLCMAQGDGEDTLSRIYVHK